MKRSLRSRIHGRYSMYKAMLKVNNRWIGSIVERFGNRVRMDGHVFSVDTPLISTPHKSTLFFGLHEMEERELVKRWVPDSIPVIELGGGLGVVSCITNRKLKSGTGHVVVEANPAMIPVLERNRDLNSGDFTIVNFCLAYGAESIRLHIDEEFVGSTALDQEMGTGIDVPTTNLISLVEKHGFQLVFVICDIEGLERELIENEITRYEQVCGLIVEMHPDLIGQDVVDNLLLKMQDSGFVLRDRIGTTFFLHRNSFLTL